MFISQEVDYFFEILYCKMLQRFETVVHKFGDLAIHFFAFYFIVYPIRFSSINRACTHDESEIQGLRDKVRDLQNNVLKNKIDVEKKEEACREYEDKVAPLFQVVD